MTTSRKPHVAPDLLEHLQALYPDSLPTKRVDLRELDERRGQVSVIHYLKRLHEEQEEDKLNV